MNNMEMTEERAREILGNKINKDYRLYLCEGVFVSWFVGDLLAEIDGCGRGSGFPDIPVWFGFWIALARGVQYAVDQIELQERLLEFFGDVVNA